MLIACVVIMKNAVFWDVGPCKSCVSRRFGGTYHPIWKWRRYGSPKRRLTRFTRRHVPEDGILHSHRRENLKSCIMFLYVEATHRHWRWRRYVPPKRRFTQDLHGATSQKTAFFIVTTVKTSNLTGLLWVLHRALCNFFCEWNIYPTCIVLSSI
jgi:hypothetical protein